MKTTHATFEEEIARHYRYNAIVNILDATCFWFGASFIASRTILPVYVSRLTDSELAIGALSVIVSTGWLLPQIFTVNWVHRLPRKKVVPVRLGLFTERLPVMLMVPAALLAVRTPVLALVAFLALIAWHTLGAGVVAVGWQDMIAKIIPIERRGKFFGLANFGGTATGVVGAQVASWLLDRYEFPYGYTLCFALAAAFIFASWIFIALTREPAQVNHEPVSAQQRRWSRFVDILRTDLNYRRYLISQLVTTAGGMAVGFLSVYAAQRFHLPDSEAGHYTTTMLVSQALCNLLFGALADRKGYKIVIELSTLSGAGAVGLAGLAPAPAWFHAVFALFGASTAGFILGGLMIVFEFCSPEMRPAYIGLNNTAIGIPNIFVPLVGGWLAKAIGYQWLFVVSCVISLGGLALLHWMVHDPRRVDQRAGGSPPPAPL